MGMDLSGAGGYFRWTNAGWNDILELSQQFGWVPMGTGPPRGELKAHWGEGPYHSNEGQLFYARDARALADALERALEAISEGNWPVQSRPARATDYLEAELAGRNAAEERQGRHPAVWSRRCCLHPGVYRILSGWQLPHLLTATCRTAR